LSVIAEILLSVRLLPIDVITKQLDCCTARRIKGSMVVTFVAAPKLANHSLPRPSSTASVPRGASQRSRPELAPALVEPPAAPLTAVALGSPVVTEPPLPGVTHPASRSEPASMPARPEIHF
jgi:hypothetical protein